MFSSKSEVGSAQESLVDIQKMTLQRAKDIIKIISHDSSLGANPDYISNPLIIAIINAHSLIVNYLVNQLQIDLKSTLKYRLENEK